MLDFGLAELLFIIILGIFFIGPNEIPALMVGLGRIVRRLHYVRFAMSQQFEDFMREHDLQEMRDSVNFEAGHAVDPSIVDEAAEDEAYLAEVTSEDHNEPE